MCRRQVWPMELGVKACVTGDRTAALQAPAMDPLVTDLDMARGIPADYLKLHGDLMPQFRQPRKRETTRRDVG